jgi:hypothetical protein
MWALHDPGFVTSDPRHRVGDEIDGDIGVVKHPVCSAVCRAVGDRMTLAHELEQRARRPTGVALERNRPAA